MKKVSRGDIYVMRGSSTAQRTFFTLAIGLWIAVVWWLLTGGGIPAIGAYVGHTW
jgi:hypothetical protein